MFAIQRHSSRVIHGRKLIIASVSGRPFPRVAQSIHRSRSACCLPRRLFRGAGDCAPATGQQAVLLWPSGICYASAGCFGVTERTAAFAVVDVLSEQRAKPLVHGRHQLGVIGLTADRAGHRFGRRTGETEVGARQYWERRPSSNEWRHVRWCAATFPAERMPARRFGPAGIEEERAS